MIRALSLAALTTLSLGAATTPATALVEMSSPTAKTPYHPSKPRTLVEKDGKFLLDGKPFQFICGEMHYNRIPRELWRDRLHKAKVMGINCVSAYVFWSFHEKSPGEFDFTGNADVAEFIRLAHEEGLFVYLRPGPYVCAEYDFGGYPYWLLNEKDLKWRSRDPKFIALMDRYITALAGQLKDLQIDQGGPIAFVQVENEYGSYSNDKVYLAQIRDMLKKAGFTAMLTTCDGGGQMPNGKVEGCLPTINGAVGEDIQRTIDRHHPGGPYFVSEFYPAWFDVWGRPHAQKSIKTATEQYRWMLEHDVHVSLYMFHGGTNFWYTNGANTPPYAPQPTSYDYNAPLGEYGNMTPKFMAMREVAEKLNINGEKLPPIPPQPKIVTVPKFELTQSAPLSAILPASVKSERPMTMEALKQDFGYVLYRTTLTKPYQGILKCNELRDFGFVMLNGKMIGQMDRRHDQNTIQLKVDQVPATLEILVENVGRINYGPQLLNNHKGITQSVWINDEEILNWEQFSLPLHQKSEAISKLNYGATISNAQAFHRGEFTLSERGEVFLDLGSWGKGSVWVNGHSLGKFWSIGPQQTMYLPSCWVKEGRNEVIVLELDDRNHRSITGLAQPVLDHLQQDRNANRGITREGANPALDAGDCVASADKLSANSPNTITFANPVTARHIAIEILHSHGNADFTSLADLEILDSNGKPISTKGWKVWYASSEETSKEKSPAENAIDGNPNTLWHTSYSSNTPKPPHILVIDMGDIQSNLGAIRLTPRKDESVGNAEQVKIYARPQFFLPR